MRTRRTTLSAVPARLAAAIADRPGAALLTSADGRGPTWVACDPVQSSWGFDPEPHRGWGSDLGELADTPRWIGVLPYEACRHLERARWTRHDEDRPAPHLSLPQWLRYDAIARVWEGEVTLVGESEQAIERLHEVLRHQPTPRAAGLEALPREAPTRHAARIRVALELIGRGDLYQVNLARRFEYQLHGDAFGLIDTLASASRAPFAAALNLGETQVCASSPELFLQLRPDGSLLTEPIKGTRPRGADPAADEALRRELDADPKERAELTMILDVERNDLGRIAETGSVKLLRGPEVVSHPTIHHRQALLGAQLRAECTRADVLRAMLPSGSVTGAPKVRAMEVIACLEPQRRGLYTGAYGCVTHGGGLQLAMAIRVLTLKQGRAHYHSGGGIVADSDPEREVEETEWKARQLSELLRTDRAAAAS